ncbi:MAG TPA: hypothetical protein VHK88_08205 [Aquihabitans sp.]|jgi:hypothetical protein|nr:hypothetical protein [Aquihabitans sp.]
MRVVLRVGAVLALAVLCSSWTGAPVGAQEATVFNTAARHSTDGMGGQGAEPGTITVETGADPLGVAPFTIGISCSNGFTDSYEVPANTTLVAYSTTAADGIEPVICDVTQADTVVYETTISEQSSACFRPQPEPCEPGTTLVRFQNAVPLLPSLSIVKQTNGADASSLEDAVELVEGDEVTWTYELVNDGEFFILGETVEVVDDVEGPVSCDVPELMAPDTSVTCEPITGTAVLGEYENTVTATAEARQCQVCSSVDVEATDTSHYLAIERPPTTTTTTTTTTPGPSNPPPAAAPANAVAGRPTYTG